MSDEIFIFKHIPTKLVFKFKVMKDTGMSRMFQSIQDPTVIIWSGFLIAEEVKDWEEIK